MGIKRVGIGIVFACCVWGQGGFDGPGRYEISNLKSGKVMDLDRNDQTTVIQFSSRGTDNQAWDIMPADRGFYFFRNAMNGNALTADDRNAVPVRGLPFNGDPSQQWRVEQGRDGNALIVSRFGKVLDIPDGTSRDGARIQVFERNGDANQLFIFRRIAGRFDRDGDRRDRDGDRRDRAAVMLTCSSDDGDRRNCPVDTRGGVQMARQISGSPCIQGRTWGFDDRGIWVDRGCRAEFQVGAVYNRPVAAVITCEPDGSGRRTMCRADTRQGVQLLRQLSDAPCVQGQTWGFDEQGIWVARGCRGEFQIGPPRRFDDDRDRR